MILHNAQPSLQSLVTFFCEYTLHEYFTSRTTKGQFYQCENTNLISIKERGVVLEKVMYVGRTSNTPVFVNGTDLNRRISTMPAIIWYFPKGIEKFFPNLNYINFGTLQMKEITKNDLKVFPELVHLNLENNQIKVLEKDLFKFNPKLFRVSFKKNDILFIDPNILDNLNNLDLFILEGNRCISSNTDNKDLVKIKKSIADFCQSTEKIIEKEIRKAKEKKRGKYFWVLLICGVIVAVFTVCGTLIFVFGAVKKCRLRK